MKKHLSDKGVSMYMIGEIGMEERRHAEECAACQARIARLAGSLSQFRGAVREWSDRAQANGGVSDQDWQRIAALLDSSWVVLQRSLNPIPASRPY